MKLIRNKTAQSWLWLAAILVLWETAARLGLLNAYILPPFSRVAVNFARELLAGALGARILNSLLFVLEGFALSFAFASVIVLLSAKFAPLESLFNMLSTVMNPLPSVAVMPLVIMWFGINRTAMLVVILHGVLWAFVRHLLDGLRAVPDNYLKWGRNIGLSVWGMFTGILFFALLPELLAGARIAWGRAWRALISVEMIFGMIGAMGGVGYYIYQSRAYANMLNVMSGVIAIVLIGLLFETLIFGGIEKRTVRKWGMTRE